MNVRSTVIAVVLAVVAVAGAMAVRRVDSSASTAPGESRRLLTPEELPVDDIDRVSLTRAGAETLEFERRGVDWVQVSPIAHPMDPFSIRRLVTVTQDLEVSQAVPIESAADSTTFGLEPPAGVITYAWPEGELTLELGRRGIAGRAYVRRPGEQTVFVTGQDLHDRAIEMDPKEWRDRQLFLHAGIDSLRIEMNSAGEQIQLERERRRWMIRTPVSTRLDPQLGLDLFDALGRARSSGFILDQPDDLGRFGLDPPIGDLEVTTERTVQRDGGSATEVETERLIVGARAGDGRYAMINGRETVVLLSAAVLQALFRPVEQIIDPTASGVSRSDVKSIEIRSGGASLRLVRDLERWQLSDSGDEVDYDAVEELIGQLTDLRAPRVVVVPDYPRDMELAVIILYGYDHRAIDTVRVLRDPETEDWALENGDNVLRVLPAATNLRLTVEAFGG